MHKLSCNVKQINITGAKTLPDKPSEEVDNLAGKILNSTVFPFAFPAIGWILAWNAQLLITEHFYLPDYLSAIYFTSGVQICATLLFGLRGVIGSEIGSIVAFWMFPHDRYPASITELGLLTLSLSIIAYSTVELVRWINKLDESFEHITLRNLVTMVLVYNAASSVAHYIWTNHISHSLNLPHEYVLFGFMSRVVGSFIVMYSFMAIFEILMRVKTRG